MKNDKIQELVRVTERIWYYPYEKELDRPILGYIKGDHYSVAVDAGHSETHTKEFYEALQNKGLPFPKFTILTHWHWDHTFGMHAVTGRCISNDTTETYLKQIKVQIENEGTDAFFSLDPSIRKEYEENQPVIVKLPDIVFSQEYHLDAGNCPIHLIRSQSPHTNDSTLVVVPSERVLFLGDAAGGVFPTWEKDPVLCRKLADTIAGLDVDICLESHHDPQTKQEMIEDLRSK